MTNEHDWVGEIMSMKTIKTAVLFFAASVSAFSAVMEGEANPDGSFMRWHRIEVVFEGPRADESAATFRNHRLDVTFTSPSGKEYKVPGFFDATG